VVPTGKRMWLCLFLQLFCSVLISGGTSGSNGTGGGVVIIVHPIHMEITRTASTKRSTGRPTAHSWSHCGKERTWGKKAIKYPMAMISEITKIAPPYS